MPDTPNTPVPSEFAKIPLEAIIGAPLDAVAKAQRAAADNTIGFIQALADKSQSFQYSRIGEDGREQKVAIKVPTLALVPTPHIRIDSVTTHFKYEISESLVVKKDTSATLEGSAGIKYLPIVDLSLKGSIQSSSADDSTTNRSGVLEITVHASEAPMPEGLAKVLSLLANAAQPQIQAQTN